MVKIINNFVSEEDCNAMIARLEELIESGNVTKHPDNRIGIINLEDDVFKNFVEKYKEKTIQTINDEFIHFSGYIATKYPENTGMHTHTDSQSGEEMGALMYLNDDYEGGELTYTDDSGEFHTLRPKRGDMAYVPSWYPHGVNKVTRGTRYFFTVSLMNHKP